MEATATAQTFDTESIVSEILETIDREREREIIARRFGLFDRRETLEQIGEILGITRERVRQLEKAVVAKLKAMADSGELPNINEAQKVLSREIYDMGKITRINNLGQKLTEENSRIDQSRLAFLSELCPQLAVVEDNDHYYHSVGLASEHDEKAIKAHIDNIIKAIKNIGKPSKIEDIAREAKIDDHRHAAALATTSKQLASLNGQYGLAKWPTVNPKNIRDKIYVILQEKHRHMHFNEIANAIKQSDFKRKDVTTQAIHNELIKDKRFVLIGRGIYALREWGYEKGTVADIISDVLKKANQPLHRDEIVKQVLKNRHVKETTILLNLQGKPQFKRVAKATYALAE